MIYKSLQKLIDYGIENQLISSSDVYVIRNQLMEALRLTDWRDTASGEVIESIDEILLPIIDYAVENGIINDTTNSRDLFDTKIMGILTPMPREIGFEFNYRRELDPREATDWYYNFSKKTNYVRAGRISKDLKWNYDTDYGTLDITINRSKPEKDPRDIAAAGKAKSVAYPKCQLCAENAGFAGNANHPARQNLRPVSIDVQDEEWQLQYSPYGYYNEHCIVFNTNHVPMKIDRSVFEKMLDIVDFLPHYFIGSNADLPIVGGSILSHEHFQGGNYTFAMETAPIETPFKLEEYPDVQTGIVKWPMSVIRVKSSDRNKLVNCCAHILKKWREYSDPKAGIFAQTDGTAHNTITPIVRINGYKYECDLVLRNNITSEDRPLGVFHPAPELHHIKKENIGLIEVMGLAVLPSRLATEMEMLEKAIINKDNIEAIPELASHAAWANEIIENHPEITEENVQTILRDEIGKVFLKVLEDAGVYKRTPEGHEAFLNFIKSL